MCIEWSPFLGANRPSASHEMSHILWTQTVRYLVHNNPPLFLVPSRMNSVRTVLYDPLQYPSASAQIFHSVPFPKFSNSDFVCIYHLPHSATGSTVGIRDVISIMLSLCGISPLNPKLCLVRSRSHEAPHYLTTIDKCSQTQLLIFVLLTGVTTQLVLITTCFGLYIGHHQFVHSLILKQTMQYTIFFLSQNNFLILLLLQSF